MKASNVLHVQSQSYCSIGNKSATAIMDPSVRKAMNEALCDQSTTQLLSSSGDAAKNKRKENKLMREARETAQKQAEAQASGKGKKVQEGSNKGGV